MASILRDFCVISCDDSDRLVIRFIGSIDEGASLFKTLKNSSCVLNDYSVGDEFDFTNIYGIEVSEKLSALGLIDS